MSDIERWTIWKRVGEWDDVIVGPDTGTAQGDPGVVLGEGTVVVPLAALAGVVAHVEEAVTIAIVMLAGIGDVWAELDYPERCARAENELRALLDHLGGQS